MNNNFYPLLHKYQTKVFTFQTYYLQTLAMNQSQLQPVPSRKENQDPIGLD